MRQTVARALWYTGPGKAELRDEPLAAPSPDEIVVQTLYSGVSRGTERLVSGGAVGESERVRMRCPLQSGDFPFPVKYGYCAVGQVVQGHGAISAARFLSCTPIRTSSRFRQPLPAPFPRAFPRAGRRLPRIWRRHSTPCGIPAQGPRTGLQSLARVSLGCLWAFWLGGSPARKSPS